MMRIVVLDGYTLNPGDLAWDGLRELGECHIYDRTPKDVVADRARGAQAILTNKAIVGRQAIEGLPELRYVGVLATGYNIVDITAATERQVTVTNVPAYAATSVAQLVFAFLLEFATHVGHHAQTVRDGRWQASPDFCYWDYPLTELAGLALGVVGFGQIGQSVAQLGQAFGMTVIATSRTPRPAPPGVELVNLDELFARADVVTLHCPLTEETRGLVNARRLGLMKSSAYLINTGRGPLVVEEDLAQALNSGQIAGAGLDVLTVEPPVADNPLVRAKNCLITPHFGWATYAARRRLMEVAVANLRAFIAGKPQNVVNAFRQPGTAPRGIR